MAPVYLALKRCKGVKVTLLATAQHRHMLDQTLSVFNIHPDVDLDLMDADQSPWQLAARLGPAVREALVEISPDVVMVHGDTTSCMFAAMAAFYEHIPVAHVEAGLRTYDLSAPWPEEMNRRLTDPLCRWCFAPTERAADNLRSEHIDEDSIFVTGNTAIDALLLARDINRDNPPEIPDLPAEILNSHRVVLVTCHRRESFGKPLEEMCLALRDIVAQCPDAVVVYPVHPNPNVRGPVEKILSGCDRVHLTGPLAYSQFVYLMERSYFLVTDSGGIQEEAPSLEKPVLVTRDATERPEVIEAGLAKLVGMDRQRIFREAQRLLSEPQAYADMIGKPNPYGQGFAAEEIVRILLESL